MKKILILGASSPTGKVLLAHFQKSNPKDIEINCYARTPEKLSSFKSINIIKGDTTDQPNLSNCNERNRYYYNFIEWKKFGDPSKLYC